MDRRTFERSETDLVFSFPYCSSVSVRNQLAPAWQEELPAAIGRVSKRGLILTGQSVGRSPVLFLSLGDIQNHEYI